MANATSWLSFVRCIVHFGTERKGKDGRGVDEGEISNRERTNATKFLLIIPLPAISGPFASNTISFQLATSNGGLASRATKGIQPSIAYECINANGVGHLLVFLFFSFSFALDFYPLTWNIITYLLIKSLFFPPSSSPPVGYPTDCSSLYNEWWYPHSLGDVRRYGTRRWDTERWNHLGWSTGRWRAGKLTRGRPLREGVTVTFRSFSRLAITVSGTHSIEKFDDLKEQVLSLVWYSWSWKWWWKSHHMCRFSNCW